MTRFVKLAPYCFISGENSGGGGAEDLLHCSLPFLWRLQSECDTRHPCLVLGNIQLWSLLFLKALRSSEAVPLSIPALSCFPNGKFLVQNMHFGRLEQLLSVQHMDAFRLKCHGRSPRRLLALCNLKVWNKPLLYHIWQQNPVMWGKTLQLSAPSLNSVRWHRGQAQNMRARHGLNHAKQGMVQSSISNCLFCPRSIPQARAGKGNAVALQFVLLVFLRGWSERVS